MLTLAAGVDSLLRSVRGSESPPTGAGSESARVGPMGWFGRCLAEGHDPGPLLAGVPAEVEQRLIALGSPQWEERDRASRWLIVERARWTDRIPAGWTPPGAEAAWRWRGVLDAVRELGSLAATFDNEPYETLAWRLRSLHSELGAAAVPEALMPVLTSPEERLRERAVRIVADLEPLALEHWLAPLASDPSPWVRRTVYSVAATYAPKWAARLADQALAREEPEALYLEAIALARRLGEYSHLQSLRRGWDRQGPNVRAEISLALCGRGELCDRTVLGWMAASGEYRLILPALSELEGVATAADVVALLPLIGSTYPEVRVRAQRLVRRIGSAECALELLPHLESEDAEVARFAAGCILEWRAEDYYGDVACVLPVEPASRVPSVAREGEVGAVPAPAREGDGEIVPLLVPGREP